MKVIDATIREVNPYVDQYRRLKEIVAAEAQLAQLNLIQRRIKRYELRLIINFADHQRPYNAPSTKKECMYRIENSEGEVPAVDLAVRPISQRGCTRLNPYSRHVGAMVFPFFFPSGDVGYFIGVSCAITGATIKTPLQFYASRIACRQKYPIRFIIGVPFSNSTLFRHIVLLNFNVYNNYIRLHQKQLKVDSYQGLVD